MASYNNLFGRIFNILPNGFYFLQSRYTEQFILNNKYTGNFTYEYCNISRNKNIRSYYLKTDITLVSNHCNKVYKELYQYSFNEFKNPPAIYRNYNLLENGYAIEFKNLPTKLIDSLDKKKTIDS
jgi:hypothetical protein